MAIFQKAYQGYYGPVSPPFERTLVIFRYALADAFRSRLFVAFFAICFLPSVALMCAIYTYYNLDLLLQFDVVPEDLLAIDGSFFFFLMQMPQTFLIFVLVITVGPTMISPDLRNNAMPLYLSRSISKASYIMGKLLVLLVLGSLISWIPGIFLILFQAWMGGDGWLADNLYLLVAAPVSSLISLVSLSLLAFAVSAWVKWKVMARVAFFGVLFLGSILGDVIQEIFGGWAGNVVDLTAALEVLVDTLYRNGQLIPGSQDMPVGAAAAVFLLVSILSIAVLTRRIRAFQVVS